MTMTTEELRTQLIALQAEHDAIYRELTPTAKPGPDGRMCWTDENLAGWMGCSLDIVRSWVVQHLRDFAVTDDCRCALLGGKQLIALCLDDGVTLNAPRLRELDFVDAQLSLVTSRLRELDGG
jgi:hypothetical protein